MMDNKHAYTLEQISHWTKDDSDVVIPALQRGLVWKPAQVELLWDSILRGFPVGSFMLSVGDGSRLDLMDGQQRANAVSIGFGENDDMKAILWLDISPEEHKSSTRSFWVKVCTISHPWGYQNNDECGGLSAGDRRMALEKFGMKDTNIYCSDIDLHKTWPYKAIRPIPLQYFLKASTDNEEKFIEDILRRCKEGEFVCCKNINDNDKENISKFFEAFRRVKDYEISCNLIPENIIQEESGKSMGDMTALEVLFTRINTGGTRISGDDLNYSAIKAYWPKDMRDINDRIAAKYMSPSKLVMLTFRLALSGSKDQSFKGNLSVKQIRQIAGDKEKRAAVMVIYNDMLDKIMDTVDKWLNVFNSLDCDYSSTPAVLRTSIARNSPDVFLLLMYFAKEGCCLSSEFIRALAFYLHWFFIDKNKQTDIVNEIFIRCQEGINEQNIIKAISSLIGKDLLVPLYSPDEMRLLFEINPNKGWTIRSEDYHEWERFINKVCRYSNSETKEMLLFAEREFMNKNFTKYDPARQDMWENHNRPWDYDHITPKNWTANKRGHDYKWYCDHWIGNIGNIAAIPFEKNREKSDKVDYGFYESHQDELLFDSKSSNSIKPNLIDKQEMAVEFATVTWNRTCRIYERCFEMLKPIYDNFVLSDGQDSRKKEFSEICSRIENCKSYFFSDGVEYLLERELDWTRKWISCGVIKGDYYACVNREYGSKIYHIGLHRVPGQTKKKDLILSSEVGSSYEVHADDYWYLKKEKEAISIIEIVEELKYLISIIP